MTPAGFLSMQRMMAEQEARETALYGEIVETCDALRLLPQRHLNRVAEHAAYAQLRARLQRAFDDLAETITGRLEIREHMDAEPLAALTVTPGTRH